MKKNLSLVLYICLFAIPMKGQNNSTQTHSSNHPFRDQMRQWIDVRYIDLRSNVLWSTNTTLDCGSPVINGLKGGSRQLDDLASFIEELLVCNEPSGNVGPGTMVSGHQISQDGSSTPPSTLSRLLDLNHNLFPFVVLIIGDDYSNTPDTALNRLKSSLYMGQDEKITPKFITRMRYPNYNRRNPNFSHYFGFLIFDTNYCKGQSKENIRADFFSALRIENHNNTSIGANPQAIPEALRPVANNIDWGEFSKKIILSTFMDVLTSEDGVPWVDLFKSGVENIIEEGWRVFEVFADNYMKQKELQARRLIFEQIKIWAVTEKNRNISTFDSNNIINSNKIRSLPGVGAILQSIQDHPDMQTKIVNDISHFYRPDIFSRIEQVYTTSRGVVINSQLAMTELRNLKINYIIQTCDGAIAKCYEYGTQGVQGNGSQPTQH